jgi:glycosyltransferase involved in cell wall biosynthesis
MPAATALIVSAVPPTPPDTGKRVVLNGLLRYLVDRLGPANVHYGMVGVKGATPPAIPAVVHHLDRPRPGAQLSSLARCLVDRSYTVQEAMLGSRTLNRQVRALVQRVNPTIEVYDTLRLGQHAPRDLRSPLRVLYVDDLFSVRYERMLEVVSRDGVGMDPLGGFADNIPARLHAVARHPAVYLPLLRFERNRIRRREAEIVHGFDTSLLVNADEVSTLRQRSGLPTIEPLTPLLPAAPAPVRAPVDPPEFVFLGNLNLPHNDDAVSTFVRAAMPALESRLPGVRLRIVGRHASEELQRLAAAHPASVSLEGFVDDLDEVLARASAVLAPLRFGSGVKIKVLDALARGIPVVGTTTAAEGIPAAPGGADGFVVEDDISRWPELLAALAQTDRGARLSDAALRFFARTYSSAVVTAQYDAIFGLSPVLSPNGAVAAGG